MASMAPDNRAHHRPRGSAATAGLVALVPSFSRSNSARDFDIWFLDFSNDYNLNLRRPDPGLSVEATRQLPYYADLRFFKRLQYHYHQGNADHIRHVFHEGACEIHNQWVKKPRGDPDVTPPYTDIPRATTEPERTRLLDHLNTILDSFSPRKPTRAATAAALHENLPTLDQSLTSLDPPSPSATRRSKRPSGGGNAEPPYSKRPKSAASNAESDSVSVLSRLDSGPVRAVTPVPDYLMESFDQHHVPAPPKLQRNIYSLPVSANTSRTSLYSAPPVSANTSRTSFLSRIFSDADADVTLPATQGTEVTVEASSQEKRRRPPPASPSLDSLAPSSSTERALDIAFNESFVEQAPAQAAVRKLLSRNSLHSGNRQVEPSIDPIPDSESFGDPIKRSPSPIIQSVPTTYVTDFGKRLEDVWLNATLPPKLQDAPLAVRWEITRIALHCGVSMDDLKFEYEPILDNQTRLWGRLSRLHVFRDKSFPEKTRPEAWAAAFGGTFASTDQVVLLTATLSLNPGKQGSPFALRLSPLKLDLGHRLDRRFGSDRFLELVMPSLYNKEIEKIGEDVVTDIHRWLVRDSHFFLGREWRSFYTKQALPRKLHSDNTFKKEITIMQDRIYMFAEGGNDFVLSDSAHTVSPKLEPVNGHTRMTRRALIEWLLQVAKNEKQPTCKLFSRLALGLSRTHPTVVLQPHQIRHREKDLVSPTGKVMNDGIARMSTGLVRRIRDVMGLSDLPAGFQGRFGSAKGFWLRDIEDMSDDIWIETYPSQRKWECDYAEEDHRTFEVRNESRQLKSATLNLQLLPILEDRATDREKMRVQVGNFMRDSLLREIEKQRDAMKDPAHFRLWVHENGISSRRNERIKLGHVRWSGGLPDGREDQMDLLLSCGFDPTKLTFLRNISYDMRKEKCEELRERLNVKVGRSTYAYMVIDFLGILKEDEIHLGFSSNFVDEDSGFNETFLHGLDVLVARTPAHFPSDIQRVKAVFKPELGALKDVIIFPRTGDIPLADKLSGGDYDGDIAWVCWEPSVVENFTNADPPIQPDLFTSNVLKKTKDTYRELANSCRSQRKDATTEFLDQAFAFNMQQNLLGTCTNYKERLCYSRDSVRDEYAVFLSTLISHLVDRAKQGIVFEEQDWNNVRKELNAQQSDRKRARSRQDPPQPLYKNTVWTGNGDPRQIIDYVKFKVGIPLIGRELNKLDEQLNQHHSYDADLIKVADHYEKLRRPLEDRRRDEQGGRVKPNTWETALDELTNEIHAVFKVWQETQGDFNAKLGNAFDKWTRIRPSQKLQSKTVMSLLEESSARVGLSSWDLLKASLCFRLYYRKSPSFPWYVAGSQLAFMKSIAVTAAGSLGGAFATAPPVLLTPGTYAGSRPDPKFIRGVGAVMEGRRLGLPEEETLVEDDFDKESTIILDD